MKSLLRIITFSVSIIMSLLPIITIITYYYVFETEQLADGYTIPNCDIPYWYIPCMVYTMVYHIQNASYHMCDITHVICNCDITYFVWYIPCDITYMVYTILWYTINCDIPWYILMVYSLQFPVYTILNRYDIYHVIYLTYITWYIPCDIAFMWNDTCDIPLCVI